MSAPIVLGTRADVSFWHKADVSLAAKNVRLRLQSGLGELSECFCAHAQ